MVKYLFMTIIISIMLGGLLGFSLSQLYFHSEPAFPQHRIDINDVKLLNTHTVINVPDLISKYTLCDSYSMSPVLGCDTTVLAKSVNTHSELNVGDIVIIAQIETPVIHRIIDEGVDDTGWYCITKGDNNNNRDTTIRRFSDILYVVVGIIY